MSPTIPSRENFQRIAEAKQRATAARAEAVRRVIAETAHLSTHAAADTLNCRGIRTTNGKQWHAIQVPSRPPAARPMIDPGASKLGREAPCAGPGASPPQRVCEFFTSAGWGFEKQIFDGAQVTRSGTIKRSECT